MRKLYVEKLRVGMLIGQDVPSEQGQILLTRGTPLTTGYIEGLRLRDFPAVWILDGMADDVEPPDILPSKLRATTTRHLQQLYSAAQGSVDTEGGQIDEAVFQQIADAAKPQLAQLFRDAESIVDAVARAGVLSGVISLKSHDNYTFEHSVEVAITAVLLGQRVHLESYEMESLALGCLFHDLGKIMVPRQILNKATGLTSEEFELVKKHPETGYQMVRRILGEPSIIARHIARQHHERQDGGGYPQGLRGKNSLRFAAKRGFGSGLIIPEAEIASVADVYSALASDRSYRASMKPELIISTMRQMAGSHLNRELVARFLAVLPVYPVCAEVVVISGRLKGYRGIVARHDPRRLNRPIVRILNDSRGRHIAPFEVDTGKEGDIDLATPSYSEMVTSFAV